METIERLRNRIASAEGLLEVVKTMKGVSAVYVRQYRKAEKSLDAYGRTVQRALQILLHRQPEALQEPLTRPPGGPVAAIMFGSEHGLCGRFNEALAEHTFDQRSRAGAARETWHLFPVGGRMAGLLEGRETDQMAPTLALPESLETLADRARDALVTLEAQRAEHGFSRILLFHHKTSEQSVRPEPRTVRLFPLDMDALRSLAKNPWPSKVIPTFTVAPSALLAAAVREHVFMALHAAFADSLAAENAARLQLMQAGQRNVEDKLSDLRSDYHHRRQESITGELLDVTAAFEILRSRSRSRSR